MRRMRRSNRKQGQSALELAILFAVVIIAFVALQYYVRNAAAGRLKSSADSVSQTQFDPLKGITNLTVNRQTVDKTFGVQTGAAAVPAPPFAGAYGANGNAGRTESNSVFDNSVRNEK